MSPKTAWSMQRYTFLHVSKEQKKKLLLTSVAKRKNRSVGQAVRSCAVIPCFLQEGRAALSPLKSFGTCRVEAVPRREGMVRLSRRL